LILDIDGTESKLDITDTKTIIEIEDGTHSISLKMVDLAGWETILEYPSMIKIDTTTPTIQIKERTISEDGIASISWTSSDVSSEIASVLISVDEEAPKEISLRSFDTGVLPQGSHTIVLRITDEAGNSAEEKWEFQVEEMKTRDDEGSASPLPVVIIFIVVVILCGAGASLFIYKKRGKGVENDEEKHVVSPSEQIDKQRQVLSTSFPARALPPQQLQNVEELPPAQTYIRPKKGRK